MKWLKRVVLGFLAIIVLAVLVVYIGGGIILNDRYEVEQRNLVISSRPEIIEHGKRLSQVLGCFYGCHGDKMEGEVFFEGWAIGKIVSPNLTTAMEEFTQSELEAMIRQGVRPDGSSVFAMPSASFSTMTDSDLSAILSFINSYPKQENQLQRSRYGLFPRLMLLIGEFQPAAREVAEGPWSTDSLQDPLKLGEYMALNACSECHGLDFEGQGEFTPDLAITKGYTLENFKKLMSTGLGVGDRDLGLMSVVAVNRFKKMTDEEVEALHQFLVNR